MLIWKSLLMYRVYSEDCDLLMCQFIKFCECQETRAGETKLAMYHKQKQSYQGVIISFLTSACNHEYVKTLANSSGVAWESWPKVLSSLFLLKNDENILKHYNGWDSSMF